MILVRDLDRAVRDYETLGFAVTPDGAEAVLQPDKQVHLEAERTRLFCWRKLRSVTRAVQMAPIPVAMPTSAMTKVRATVSISIVVPSYSLLRGPACANSRKFTYENLDIEAPKCLSGKTIATSPPPPPGILLHDWIKMRVFGCGSSV